MYPHFAIEPEVRNSHDVLSQGPGLVWTDDGRWTESLDGLQASDQTVLRGHSLGGQSKTDGDNRKNSWNIRYSSHQSKALL